MTTEQMTPAEIRRLGVEALIHALGVIGATRFLRQIAQQSEDYTEKKQIALPDDLDFWIHEMQKHPSNIPQKAE